MAAIREAHTVRHRLVTTFASVAAVSTLLAFRVMVELGFGPQGSLSIKGVPVEYPMIAWFGLVLALTFDSHRVDDVPKVRVATYQWFLGVAGLAGVMWLAQEAYRAKLIGSVGPVYWFACLCALAIFAIASVRPSGSSQLREYFFTDVARIIGRPTTWAAVLGAIALMAFAPRSPETPTGGRAFVRWYLRQTSVAMPETWQPSPVTLVEVTDYQCPICRRTADKYREAIQDATRNHHGVFAFLRVDFPLESECNSFGQARHTQVQRHPAACEAAVAVRLARMVGPEEEDSVAKWMWKNQPNLTPTAVFDGIMQTFGIDVRGRYAEVLPVIRRDADMASKLGVRGTPTFFLNGRRLPMLSAKALATAIIVSIDEVTPKR
jgi:protein-disulfide isomerase